MIDPRHTHISDPLLQCCSTACESFVDNSDACFYIFISCPARSMAVSARQSHYCPLLMPPPPPTVRRTGFLYLSRFFFKMARDFGKSTTSGDTSSNLNIETSLFVSCPDLFCCANPFSLNYFLFSRLPYLFSLPTPKFCIIIHAIHRRPSVRLTITRA